MIHCDIIFAKGVYYVLVMDDSIFVSICLDMPTGLVVIFELIIKIFKGFIYNSRIV